MTESLNLLHEFYFAYDRSNFVKESFISEIKKFFPMYFSISYFIKKRDDKSQIISVSTQKSFAIEEKPQENES